MSDARTSYTGTGLGLSIVKRMLDQMGGRIDCVSDSGKGSTFHHHPAARTRSFGEA